MKNFLKPKLVFLFVMLFSIPLIVKGPGPPPPPQKKGKVLTIPIDGGIGILLAAGAIYGIKKLYSFKKKVN